MDYLGVKIIRPTVFAVVAVVAAGLLIFGIGQLLLAVHDFEVTSELERKELWMGVILTVAILAVAGFLASRPTGSLGSLEEPVAIGSKPLSSAYQPGPADPGARQGRLGSASEVATGYTLYARSGSLAEVSDVLHNVEDTGGRLRTLIYGRGVAGAQDEIWIPIEAVSAVYPETRSAFLAVAGDEVEAFGWDKAPASFSRVEQPKETPLY